MGCHLPMLPLWVKNGKTQNEHMFSGLLPKADLRSGINEYTPHRLVHIPVGDGEANF
jgi:hypothetical protein